MSKEGRNEQVDKKVLNIKRFCMELSEIVDQKITYEHVHPVTDGRYYYTQAPEEGFPMLLRHYRGVYCVDIHPNDYKKMEMGEITPRQYIYSAKFLVGYYWGGGSVFSGAYYQPLDIINQKEEVQRYLKILSCRGNRRSSGHTPDFEDCTNCSVENCPMSNFKNGSWDKEIQEVDYRKDFYKALVIRMNYQSYTIAGLYTGNEVPENSIYLMPIVSASDIENTRLESRISVNTMNALMKQEIKPDDWDKYIELFKIYVFDHYQREYVPATKENIVNSVAYAKETIFSYKNRKRANATANKQVEIPKASWSDQIKEAVEEEWNRTHCTGITAKKSGTSKEIPVKHDNIGVLAKWKEFFGRLF